MVPSIYLAEMVARDLIREALARAEQHRLLREVEPAPVPLRVLLGMALIKLGHWLADRAVERGSEADRVRVTA